MLKLILILLTISSSAAFADESLKAQIPITMSNIEGQKKLFNKGWFLFPSPVEALKDARISQESSRQAFRRALKEMNKTTSEKDLKQRVNEMLNTVEEMDLEAAKFQMILKAKTLEIKRKGSEQAKESFEKSLKTLSSGYLHFTETNANDLESLKEINTNFFGRTKEHFDSLEKGMAPIRDFFVAKEKTDWSKHFEEGKFQFQNHYEASGKETNSLGGNWEMLKGYFKFLYHSVFKPTAKETKSAIQGSGYYTANALMKTFVVGHGIVYSLGSNLYYTTKLGYRIVAPTVEAGFLAGLSLAALVHAHGTPVVLDAAGMINKVAVKTTTPVIAGGKLALAQSADTAKHSVTYLVHGGAAVGEVAMESTLSGIALGYSALMQIPAQTLLTAVNSAIFLAWDGPRLGIYKVTGVLINKNIDAAPVGTIIDLNKLKNIGFKVEELKVNPAIIENVLRNTHEDK